MPADSTLAYFGVSVEDGLNPADARRRRRRIGPNTLRERRPRNAANILLDQFKSLIVALLGVAAGLALAFGHLTEAGAIAAVIVINTAIGFFTELRAVRSMEALRRLSVVTATVRRGGRTQAIPAKNLVPG
ncbi:MAG: cation-transporting P-type ATPase, partial [Gammaproteobacteria bacterium]